MSQGGDGGSSGVAQMEEVAILNAMGIVLLGNYSQTGHFGGPLAYVPANVYSHLAGEEHGGLVWDIRSPKFPTCDKFMLAGGHCIPVCYSLWIIMYEAMDRMYKKTGDSKYYCDPNVAMLAIDCLGFRRGEGALAHILQDNDLVDHPAFAQAKIRGIRSLAGHSESTDVSNDVNGGPSGVGVASAAGKAMFWQIMKAPPTSKVIAFEGEFAFTEGHAQELKTIALAQKVGKRLRLFFSYNNAGIDDALIGGVLDAKYGPLYTIREQWTSYGWTVTECDGDSFADLERAYRTVDQIDDNGQPQLILGTTVKGWWPLPLEVPQIVGYKSHPYAFPLNGAYFQALARSFEKHHGVKFVNIDAAPKTTRDRLIEFKTNFDILLGVLDSKPELCQWLADRLVAIGEQTHRRHALFPEDIRCLRSDPFQDERLLVANLPRDPVKLTAINPGTGKEVTFNVKLFEKPGINLGSRRAIAEVGKWMNYVTNGRLYTIAADLSDSLNMTAANIFGSYDPDTNPSGTRLKAGIQEAGNVSTVIGMVNQTTSTDPNTHIGVWGWSGTYGAFTPLMYLPLRIHSQQNQNSPFRIGVVTVICGHSGPETAADARSHFGIFTPSVWRLFPEGQIINVHCWDYNDVAPGYFAAAAAAARQHKIGVIVLHVARPDIPIVDRSLFADSRLDAAASGCYVIRSYHNNGRKLGTILLQGASSTSNAVAVIPKLGDLNVCLVSVISEELFNMQPQEYRDAVFPFKERYNCTFISSGSKRFSPLPNLGPLAREYCLTSDFDDNWRTGGTEADVIAEAHLDASSILNCILRFAEDYDVRMQKQREVFGL
jgi:transketolase